MRTPHCKDSQLIRYDRAWEHGKVEDFISMDEGSGDYTVYALCSDGVVLMIPDHELDEPTIINFQNQRVRMIHHMPKQKRQRNWYPDPAMRRQASENP